MIGMKGKKGTEEPGGRTEYTFLLRLNKKNFVLQTLVAELVSL